MKIVPGNIYSGDRERAVFTNPTALAKRKGNLNDDYPVVIRGVRYVDAETAYQKLAAGVKYDADACYDVCTEVVEAKLRQHPRVLAAIRDSGGLDWIKRCSHWVGWRKNFGGRWEGDGLASGYIRCLAEAYRRVGETTG